jgi:heavy metal translocating P-type ATPase
MSPRPEILSSHDRVRILNMRQGSIEHRRLELWLSSRSEVVHVEEKPDTETIIVHCDHGKASPHRFIRAIGDQLHAIMNSSFTENFDIQPIHSLEGRTRVQISGAKEWQMSALSEIAAMRPGVEKCVYIPGSNTMLIAFNPVTVSEEHLINTLRDIGLSDSPNGRHVSTQLRWGGAAAGTTVLMMCLSRAFPMPVMAAGIVLVALRPMARSVDAFINEGKLSIDSLDVAATFAALATGRPATAAFVIWMVGVGDLLLDFSANTTRHALSKLVQQRDREACVVSEDGSIRRVPVEALIIGDRFIVQAGQSIAADGRVVDGCAEVDEKALTGESRPIRKDKLSIVYASTLLLQGRIVVEVEAISKNSEVAKIERVLNTVGNKPLTLQREALELGGKLVPPTFAIAGAAAAVASSVTPGVSVLVTDFGTGIRIAVPTSALTAMTIAAREGIMVKGAHYLERLSKTDVIIFDKTGTLTSGEPEVVEVLTAKGFEESLLVMLSASAEAGQDHPVARALRAYAKDLGVELVEPDHGSLDYAVGLGITVKVEDYRVQVGRATWMEDQGIELKRFKKDLARLRSEQVSTLCVAVDGKLKGIIGYSDGTRPESASIVEKLKANGKRRVILLSGDHDEVVQKVALEVGIDEAMGSMLPEQKADYVRKLMSEGHVVAMVGDGINDAPALALADVGISIAGSAEVAIETADVVLLEGGLIRLPKAIEISEQAMRSVKRSLGIIIAPNAAAICLGAFGYINPTTAAIINNGATMTAVGLSTLSLLWTPDRRNHFKAGLKFVNKTAQTAQSAPRRLVRQSIRVVSGGRMADWRISRALAIPLNGVAQSFRYVGRRGNREERKWRSYATK